LDLLSCPFFGEIFRKESLVALLLLSLVPETQQGLILHPSFYVKSGIRDPGSGVKKIFGSGIQDKHSGSATLVN
jgi:hypothetical protein